MRTAKHPNEPQTLKYATCENCGHPIRLIRGGLGADRWMHGPWGQISATITCPTNTSAKPDPETVH